MPRTKHKKIFLALTRLPDGKLEFKIKIPVELERFFEQMSSKEIEQSAQWLDKGKSGLEFYLLNENYKKVENTLSRQFGALYFNDYGSGLFKNNRINLAPLRTKGASKGSGVSMISSKFEAISNLEFEDYIRKLGEATKTIYNYFINGKKIKAYLTFEV